MAKKTAAKKKTAPKKSAKKTENKSQVIRDYKKKHPNASAKEISEALTKEKGTVYGASAVYQALKKGTSTKKRAAKKKSTRSKTVNAGTQAAKGQEHQRQLTEAAATLLGLANYDLTAAKSHLEQVAVIAEVLNSKKVPF